MEVPNEKSYIWENSPLVDLTQHIVHGYLGYHLLLCGIFGGPKPQVKFDRVENFIIAVYEGKLPCAMSNDALEAINEALLTLTEREVSILKRRCGFGDFEQPQTLQEIADDLGITPSKVRAIEARAFKKLRHPTRSKKLRDIPVVWADLFTQIDELKKELKRTEAQSNEFASRINTEMAKYREAAEILFPLSRESIEDPRNPFKLLLNKPLSDYELSVRATNCLEYAEIKILGDLTAKTENEMLQIRNLGRHALNELKQVLNPVGLSFGMIAPSWKSFYGFPFPAFARTSFTGMTLCKVKPCTM